ncbi:MAG: site-specific DNA-methyltransferase [Candidatus Brocadia sp. WS118]|nr:MAG: site-specific DNA-methyltransferase [Candidatus Brocadia sp. WS118]
MIKNTLYYGDNLEILRHHIADESIDLIYLDPPFNSNRTYNVLFKNESGKESEAQITAFEDTWHWDQVAAKAYNELTTESFPRVSRMIASLYEFIGTNQMMAYLVMMTARLIELYKVLKPTGSLYLHCDPTASHYLKIVLDTIFGPENFLNEITWKRTSSHNDSKRNFSNVNDILLLYSKNSNAYKFYPQHAPYEEEYIKKNFRFIDSDGRHYSSDNLRSPNPRPNLTYEYKGYKPHPNGWTVSIERMEELDRQGRLIFPNTPDGRIRVKKYLDEMPGVVLGNNWDDIPPISSQSSERLGYQTQKPITLLERIIRTSSEEGDIVLDPFCGCGTTIIAAQRLNRKWIGIDITHLSISLLKYRLKTTYSLAEKVDYNVIGEPQDVESAYQLAQSNRYQFEWWALSLINARPVGGKTPKMGKKGKDRGRDGIIYFVDDASLSPKQIIVQVKSGKVKPSEVRDLIGTVANEKAAMGIFITLNPPTRGMIEYAASAGFYHSPGWSKDYPKIQFHTVKDLLDGKGLDQIPPRSLNITFKKSPKLKSDTKEQNLKLPFDE